MYIYCNLLKNLSLLKLKDYNVYQVECDSIYFSGPSDQTCPLPISQAVGDFKLEYSSPKILNFFAFGPKHYCLNFLNSDGQCENICKYSGLSLANSLNGNLITEETFEKFLNDFINNTESSIQLHQKILKSDMKNLTIRSEWQKFTFQNKICSRRFVNLKDSCNMKTFPYGYFQDK